MTNPDEKILEKAVKLNSRQVNAKTGVSPHYKNGKAFVDPKPHPNILASLNEPDINDRVDELTRLSRIRRAERIDALEIEAFERDEDIDLEMADEGITPYQIDAQTVAPSRLKSKQPKKETPERPQETSEDSVSEQTPTDSPPEE